MIQRGDKIPSVPIKLIDAAGISDTTADAALEIGATVTLLCRGQ